jgi:uncharacterized protein YbjT (DUF2867 family)
MPHAASPRPRTVLVAGATGLVGGELLQGLLADDTVGAVYAVGRRAPPAKHPKLHALVVDFGDLFAVPNVDEVYLALGTTLRQAGSRDAFRKVDFDANLAVARAARAEGAARLGLVSAMGASPRSHIFYNRVKGELEEAVAHLGYEGLVIARPSFLAGNREALGQPHRAGEKIALQVSGLLRPLVPPNLRSIDAAKVAHALLRSVPGAVGREVLLSGQMH